MKIDFYLVLIIHGLEQAMLSTFKTNPKKLFVIDGYGAIISAFFLGVVLVKLEHLFGIPKQTLYLLAFLPLLFAAFDFYAYRNAHIDTSKNLKVIATINTLYCILSLALTLYHIDVILPLGWIYIILELAIVLALSYIELIIGITVRM